MELTLTGVQETISTQPMAGKLGNTVVDGVLLLRFYGP